MAYIDENFPNSVTVPELSIFVQDADEVIELFNAALAPLFFLQKLVLFRTLFKIALLVIQ